LWIFPKSQ